MKNCLFQFCCYCLLTVLTGCASVHAEKTSTIGFYGLSPDEQFQTNRSNFGNSDYPVWVPITTFEKETLSKLPKAQSGDPEALLAFAVVASGNKRTQAEYDQIKSKVDKFVSAIKPTFDEAKDNWQKGFIVYKEMLNWFYPSVRSASNQYDADQSQMTVIFEDGSYNCISSAILFGVLSKYFGLNAQGVVLPSHAFIQLTFPNGKTIEVETTSYTGYDWVHDKNFYNSGAVDWHTTRGLPPTTYDQYVNRKVVSILELITINMTNQHTSSNRMSLENRARLIELGALVEPTNAAAAERLLSYVLWENSKIKDNHQIRLFDTLYTHAIILSKQVRNPTIDNLIAWIRIEYVSALRKSGQLVQSAQQLGAILPLNSEITDYKAISDNALFLYHGLVEDFAKTGKFEEAAKLHDDLIALCLSDSRCQSQAGWIFIHWANNEWDKQNWEEVISIYKRLYKAPYDTPLKEKAGKGLGLAYSNWTVDYHNEGNWPKVREIYTQCMSLFPEIEKCNEALVKLEKQHRF